jgi:hypothetical protein
MKKTKVNDYINYPGYDIAWIGWETQSAYCVYKIKNKFDENGNISQNWLLKQVEVEWVLKSEFNYPIVKLEKNNIK